MRTSGWLVGIPWSLEPIYQNSDRQVGPFQQRIRLKFGFPYPNKIYKIKIVSSLHPPLLDKLRRFRLPKSLYLVIFCWLVSSPHPFQSHHESKGCELNICNSFSRQTTCILAHQLGPSPEPQVTLFEGAWPILGPSLFGKLSAAPLFFRAEGGLHF